MEVWGRDQQNLALGLENALKTDNKGNRPHQRKEGRDGGSREDTKGQLYHLAPFGGGGDDGDGKSNKGGSCHCIEMKGQALS